MSDAGLRRALQTPDLTPADWYRTLNARVFFWLTQARLDALLTAELEKARLAQLDALEALRDWWNDWSVTLRPRYGTREQLKLGLTTTKKRGPSSGDELEDEEDAPTGDALAGPDALVTACTRESRALHRCPTRGRRRGMVRGAGLGRLPAATRPRVQSATSEQLAAWLRRVLTAQALDEVFAQQRRRQAPRPTDRPHARLLDEPLANFASFSWSFPA